MATHGEIMALHRYYLWADRMRVHFYQTLGMIVPQPSVMTSDQVVQAFFHHPYMPYWYGGTFVLIEGWQALGLRDAEIDAMLRSPNTKLLRRSRHGAFHFQRKYFDMRFFEFMEPERTPEWIFHLSEAFGRWFLAYFAWLREGGVKC